MKKKKERQLKRSRTSEKKLAKRFNSGKLRWKNFPLFLIEPLIEVASKGEEKYDTYNFLKGFPITDLMDSLKRHLKSYESPFEDDMDQEMQVNHLAAVAWNALVALYVHNMMPELDDRYKLPEHLKNRSRKVRKNK